VKMTREEELSASFAPVLLNYVDWKNHPEEFAPGFGHDDYLKAMKKDYRVTDAEWAVLIGPWGKGYFDGIQ